MKYYSHFGFTEFILCLGYKGDMIREYFRNYLWNTCDVTLSLGDCGAIELHDRHSEDHWRVTLANTGEVTMTASRIKRIQRYIPEGEAFLLTYGDGLSTIDITKCIDSHLLSGKTCTLTAVHPAGRFGALNIEENNQILTFSEKPQFEEAYVNGGYMVCNYRIFDYLTTDPNVMFERAPMDAIVRDGELNAFRHEGFWQPMDTYQEFQYLNQMWDKGDAPWKVW
jgi:glucose-1-phosphate cytidylyltransferase